MKNYIYILLIVAILSSCKQIELPEKEVSQKAIELYKPKIEQNNNDIRKKTTNLPSGNDLLIKTDKSVVNKVLSSIANSRNDDIKIYIYQTKGIFKEEKNVLGVKYTNECNIDSGYVELNIKSLKLNGIDNNTIKAQIELEGKGNANVSGKYTGIPASMSPELYFYINEPVEFTLQSSSNGNITLKPKPKTLTLKFKLYIKLLEWKLPWNKDISLELTDLIKPMTIPMSVKNDIVFPLPASKQGNGNIEYAPYELLLHSASINFNNDKLEYKTDIDFKKK